MNYNFEIWRVDSTFQNLIIMDTYPFMPSRLLHPYKLDLSFCHLRGDRVIYFYNCSKKCCKFYANNVNPEQMPHIAASDLDLHCFTQNIFRGPGING